MCSRIALPRARGDGACHTTVCGQHPRLESATSPYLLQHAGNPVAWWQRGEDAFAEAKRRDVPVLNSVGYAACHWSHVDYPRWTETCSRAD
jgi:hypothetical protein